MDLEALYRKLEFASFSQREQIAADTVRDVPRDELAPLVRGLEHPHLGVRLGVIEVFRRAGYREALRKLLAHALGNAGDDRIFAVRALAPPPLVALGVLALFAVACVAWQFRTSASMIESDR